MNLLFVGERRSQRARQLRVTWESGALAAKQLFDALAACSIDPADVQFCNWFEGGKGRVRSHRGTIVAMGRAVQRALDQEGIAHIAIVHPAARGTIRLKSNYIAHVRERLLGGR